LIAALVDFGGKECYPSRKSFSFPYFRKEIVS